MTLGDYLQKHGIIIDESIIVEYRLVDDSDYETYKDTDFWPGFTAEKVSFDDNNRLVLETEFDDGGVNNIKIPLSHKGEEDEDNGFITSVIGEKVRLVFLI